MLEIKNISVILTDIEGTTSSLSFVKDVLFPYERARLPDYVRKNAAQVADILKEVDAIENKQLGIDEAIGVFLRWMDEDKKITPLKTLQGLIWREGYEKGELKGHIYKDAALALKAWKASGLRLYVYSSGSIAAQKLLFGYTDVGDLTPLFSGYFDTTTGPKLEAKSYQKIAAEIKTPPECILFLSDNADEIDAADEAGVRTIIVDRESANKGSHVARSFEEIKIGKMAA